MRRKITTSLALVKSSARIFALVGSMCPDALSLFSETCRLLCFRPCRSNQVRVGNERDITRTPRVCNTKNTLFEKKASRVARSPPLCPLSGVARQLLLYMVPAPWPQNQSFPDILPAQAGQAAICGAGEQIQQKSGHEPGSRLAAKLHIYRCGSRPGQHQLFPPGRPTPASPATINDARNQPKRV